VSGNRGYAIDRPDRAGVNTLTIYGVVALSFMLLMYALESRGRAFVILFALGCVLSSIYGFASGAWPFGVVEAVWCFVAIRRAQRPG
jgi:hypothetical protein